MAYGSAMRCEGRKDRSVKVHMARPYEGADELFRCLYAKAQMSLV